ncbi:hypothetical protein [Thalassiella azotivora]
MHPRTWQVTGSAALAVLVIGGMLPLWPDGVRFGALALAAVLAVVAVVQRHRARHQVEGTVQTAAGHPVDPPRDALYEDLRSRTVTRGPNAIGGS